MALRKTRHILVLCILLSAGHTALAQNKPTKPSQQQRSDTRNGNKAYKNKAYTDAEAAYMKATDSVAPYYKAEYNMGNALYQQKQYDRAAQHYAQALKDPRISNQQKAQAYHNMGNAQLQQGLQLRNQGGGREQFQQAVNSFQEAMKLDPSNKDTKYNYSYAKKLLATAQQQQQQKQQQGGGGDNQKQQQQQDQQNKDQQQNQQQQQNQPQQGDQQKEKKQPQQPQKNQQEKDAEQLLNAVRNNEKNTLQQLQKQQGSKVDARIEKDW